MDKKAWITAHLFITWFTDIFKLTLAIDCSEEKILLNISLLTDGAPGHPRVLMERYSLTRMALSLLSVHTYRVYPVAQGSKLI